MLVNIAGVEVSMPACMCTSWERAWCARFWAPLTNHDHPGLASMKMEDALARAAGGPHLEAGWSAPTALAEAAGAQGDAESLAEVCLGADDAAEPLVPAVQLQAVASSPPSSTGSASMTDPSGAGAQGTIRLHHVTKHGATVHFL